MVKALINAIYTSTLQTFKITVLDALQMTRKAWDSVTPFLITNCLSKGGCTRREQDECVCEVSPEEGTVDDLTSIMIEQLGVTASFEEYICSDNDIVCVPCLIQQTL